MAKNEEILIEVQVDSGKAAEQLRAVMTTMSDLKREQASLKKDIEAGKDATGDLTKAYALNEKTIRELTAQQKALSGQILTTSETSDVLGDSFRELDAQCRELENQYKSLTKAQRESAEGQALKQQIIDLKQELKDFDAELGNHQRNVGNYPQTIVSLFSPLEKWQDIGERVTGMISGLKEQAAAAPAALKATAQGIGQATKAAIKFIATPIGAILAAIVVAVKLLAAGFNKLKEAFAKNDEAGTSLAKVMASFEPIIDAISAAFDKLVGALGRVLEKIASWLSANNEAIAKAQELVVAQDNLEQAERDYAVNSARRARDIAELRNKALDKDKYTFEERRKYIENAIELEKQNLAEQKAIAEENLRIITEKAKKESDTSDDTANKIAQARAAVYKAEQTYFSGVKELQGQLAAFDKEETDRQKAESDKRIKIREEEYAKRKEQAIQHMEDMRLLALANAETLQAQEQELREQAKAMLEQLDESEEEEEIPTLDDMARNIFGLDQEAVDYFKNLIDQGISITQAKAATLQDQWNRTAKGVVGSLKNMGGGFTAMGDLMGNFAEDSETAAVAQKAFAMTGIITNQAASIAEGALALAEGIRSAAGVPFPANIPAIVSITATIGGLLAGVASSIAQAKQIFSVADAGKFATGGIVGGTSYSGDNMIAHVNSREMILPMDAQKNLFDALTGSENGNAKLGIDYERMAAAFAAAPAPNLVLTELAQEQEKIVTFNEIAEV